PGDEITHLDGRPAQEAPPATQMRLRNRVPGMSAVLVPGGADGQLVPDVAPRVRVTYRRSGAPPRTVALERECFRPETVRGAAREHRLGVFRRPPAPHRPRPGGDAGPGHGRRAARGAGGAEGRRDARPGAGPALVPGRLPDGGGGRGGAVRRRGGAGDGEG